MLHAVVQGRMPPEDSDSLALLRTRVRETEERLRLRLENAELQTQLNAAGDAAEKLAKENAELQRVAAEAVRGLAEKTEENAKLKEEVDWLGMKPTARDKELGRLKEENTELNRLFELQHTRVGEATRLWQEAHGKPDVLPDLGDLVGWLLAEIERLKKEVIEAGWSGG